MTDRDEQLRKAELRALFRERLSHAQRELVEAGRMDAAGAIAHMAHDLEVVRILATNLAPDCVQGFEP